MDLWIFDTCKFWKYSCRHPDLHSVAAALGKALVVWRMKQTVDGNRRDQQDSSGSLSATEVKRQKRVQSSLAKKNTPSTLMVCNKARACDAGLFIMVYNIATGNCPLLIRISFTAHTEQIYGTVFFHLCNSSKIRNILLQSE